MSFPARRKRVIAETDLAYLAGFIDGEGCIGIVTQRRSRHPDRPNYVLRLTVSNTNPLPLRKFQAAHGGSLHLDMKQRGKDLWKPSGVWCLSDDRCATLLAQLLPYLIVKREQALLAIEFRTLMRNHKRMPREKRFLPKQVWDERAALKLQMNNLNRRGIDGKETPLC
jgi:hypothetical protein